MCIHNNPITNVVTKEKISDRIRRAVNAPIVRTKKFLQEDKRSFMEMSMYRLKKYFNETSNS